MRKTLPVALFFLFGSMAVVADPCDSFKVEFRSSDTLICPNDQVLVSAEARGGIGAYSYKWNISADNQSAVFRSIEEDTWITVEVKSVGCPNTIKDSIFINAEEIKADFRLAGEEMSVVNRPFRIDNYSEGDELVRLTVTHELGIAKVLDMRHDASYNLSLSEPGKYLLKFDIYGAQHASDTLISCSMTDTIHIDVIDSPQLFIPNAFHPKGQGPNSVFMGVGTHVTDYHMKIFGRFGELVFECEEKGCAWDGRDKHGLLMRPSSYLYQIVVTQAGVTKEYTGMVHLIY